MIMLKVQKKADHKTETETIISFCCFKVYDSPGTFVA